MNSSARAALPKSNRDLLSLLVSGNEVDYYVFFENRIPKGGTLNQSCLNLSYPSRFELQDIAYNSAEHYLDALKAYVSSDYESFKNIVLSKSSKESNYFACRVKNFDRHKWSLSRLDFAIKANYEKFRQNPKLRDFLMSTGEKVIVDADARDRIWGIGISKSNSNTENPFKWRGANLLGYSLMHARLLLSTIDSQAKAIDDIELGHGPGRKVLPQVNLY